MILGHGGAGRTALEMATEILKDMGGIHGLTRVSPDRLTLLAGVGPAQSSRLLAAIELGRRTLLIAPQARLPLRSPEEFASFLLPRFGAHSDERFGAVLLDSRHRFLRLHLVSEGGLDATMAVPRDVFREAAISRASAVVVFTSPSETPRPEAIALTRRSRRGRIVDHDSDICYGGHVYCSCDGRLEFWTSDISNVFLAGRRHAAGGVHRRQGWVGSYGRLRQYGRDMTSRSLSHSPE